MIIDGVSASLPSKNAPLSERAVASFLRFIEKRLNVLVVRDAGGFSSEEGFRETLQMGELLKRTGIIKEFGRNKDFADEPRLHLWYAVCNNSTIHMTSGATWESDSGALTAALVEALERYIWFSQEDYFVNPRRDTVAGIGKIGRYLAPSDVAGFSEEQRSSDQKRKLIEDAKYLWIKGSSLTSGRSTYIPAQLVSAKKYEGKEDEPLIRLSTTSGLASWPTLSGARLAGAMELIERDAFMIMWLNQLTLPRISLQSLCDRHPSLANSVAVCERYRLNVHAVQMITDAPTHAIAVVLEDTSGVAPRFTVGLRADRSLPHAIEKAMTEALRARRAVRLWQKSEKTWDAATPVDGIGHVDRLFYWSVPEHAKNLEFLIRGPEIEVQGAAWEKDSEEEHLQRILHWCDTQQYECISVSLGTSAKNPTPLFIEMTIMPDLQPLYLTESTRAFGGTRLQSIPEQFGHIPLKKPFVSAPHPFS